MVAACLFEKSVKLYGITRRYVQKVAIFVSSSHEQRTEDRAVSKKELDDPLNTNSGSCQLR
jgi:hypothetical protein